ncbi:WbuC family cupin fold metalloprotein [Synechococcus sp. HIMB2401]|uniref:WbuC family cupin fold metalloprotein n=1 Tax=Synechococcus sp. HIMB2401 TaxID=3144208 RepID=UPI0036F1F4F8
MRKSVSFELDSLSNQAFEAIKKLSYSETNTRRLCLHKDFESDLQMMLIEILPESQYPLHTHKSSDEIAILTTGSLYYSFKANPTVELTMSGQKSIIIPKGVPHSVKAGKDGAQFIEIIKGPFKPDKK